MRPRGKSSRKTDWNKYFVHSTGHGLGLEVHEEPRVARGQTVRLEAGNVITIEPGVYVEGVGGIRIEDDVVVQAGRNEVLDPCKAGSYRTLRTGMKRKKTAKRVKARRLQIPKSGRSNSCCAS